MVKGKRIKTDLQNTTQKTKDQGTRTPLKNSHKNLIGENVIKCPLINILHLDKYPLHIHQIQVFNSNFQLFSILIQSLDDSVSFANLKKL